MDIYIVEDHKLVADFKNIAIQLNFMESVRFYNAVEILWD